MNKYSVPLKNPKPDIERFIRVLKGEILPEKPPMCEYLIDDALMRPILQDMMGRKWVCLLYTS